jgi:chromosome segregation ATPase
MILSSTSQVQTENIEKIKQQYETEITRLKEKHSKEKEDLYKMLSNSAKNLKALKDSLTPEQKKIMGDIEKMREERGSAISKIEILEKKIDEQKKSIEELKKENTQYEKGMDELVGFVEQAVATIKYLQDELEKAKIGKTSSTVNSSSNKSANFLSRTSLDNLDRTT